MAVRIQASSDEPTVLPQHLIRGACGSGAADQPAATRSGSLSGTAHLAPTKRLLAKDGRSGRRYALAALGMLVTVAVIWFGITAWCTLGNAAHGPICSLTTLEHGLAREPAHWLRHNVRVLAVAQQCPGWRIGPDLCEEWHPALVDAHDAATPPLPLVVAPAPKTISWLRELPLVRYLMRQPATVGWGVPAVYVLQPKLVACDDDGESPCYAAVLQDAML